MRVLDARSAFRKMNRLARTAERIEVAVAWAGEVDNDFTDPCFGWMAEHGAKVRLVVGVADGITSATLLERRAAQGFETWVVVPRLPRALFHAKLYVFRGVEDDGERCDHVFVGSANLTLTARDRNIECLAWRRTKGAWKDDLTPWLEPDDAFPVTESWARDYRRRCEAFEANAARPAFEPPPPPPLPASSALQEPSLDRGFLDAPWERFHATYTGAMATRSDGLRPAHWLTVLNAVRDLDGWPNLNALSHDAWTRFVGRGGPHHPKLGVRDDVVHWPLFGKVEGAPSYQGIVKRRDRAAAALEQIPREGVVTDAHTYRFTAAWQETGLTAGAVSTASRLLALWRPDVFLPVTGASAARLLEVTGHRARTLPEYFALCRWLGRRPWAASRVEPTDADERAIWRARVALLDGLFFEMERGGE